LSQTLLPLKILVDENCHAASIGESWNSRTKTDLLFLRNKTSKSRRPPLGSIVLALLVTEWFATAFKHRRTQQHLLGSLCVRRKGELSAAAIDSGWPNQVVLPARLCERERGASQGGKGEAMEEEQI
jgi:hypothetical protein